MKVRGSSGGRGGEAAPPRVPSSFPFCAAHVSGAATSAAGGGGGGDAALCLLFDCLFHEFRRSVDNFCGSFADELSADGGGERDFSTSNSSSTTTTTTINNSNSSSSSVGGGGGGGGMRSRNDINTSREGNSLFQTLRFPDAVLEALAASGDLHVLQEECLHLNSNNTNRYSGSSSSHSNSNRPSSNSSSTSSSTSSSNMSQAVGETSASIQRDKTVHRDVYESSTTTRAQGARTEHDLKNEEMLICMRHCARLAERYAVISPNEEFDDIPTKHIKYLLLPYLLARLSLECTDMQQRLSRMQEAQVYLREFMASAERLRFCRAADIQAFETAVDELQQQSVAFEEHAKGPTGGGGSLAGGGRGGGGGGASMSAAAAARNELIARAKYEKQLDAKLATLFHRRRAADEESDEAEEQQRELWTLLLARAAAASPTHLSLITREIPMLLMRRRHDEEQLRRKGQPASVGGSLPPTSTLRQGGEEAAAAAKKKPWFCVVRDRSELRQLYRSKVFTPGHNLPTMSLAECAAIEMEMEVNQIGARRREVVRQYPTTHARAEAEEEEERQQREWDDWKESGEDKKETQRRNTSRDTSTTAEIIGIGAGAAAADSGGVAEGEWHSIVGAAQRQHFFEKSLKKR